MRLPIRIRFVGGPWHNLIPEMMELPTTLATLDREHVYHLARFSTWFGTHYLQYIHSSLVYGQHAHLSTYRERLPVWRIDRRVLEAKLRNRLRHFADRP